MNQNYFRALLAAVFLVGIAIVSWKLETAAAQAPQHVEFYELDGMNNMLLGNDGSIHVYKGVYQGCEIYVAVGTTMAQRSDSVAITLGRGCK